MHGGYAMHGLAEEAIRVFSDMLEANVKPDHVIMTAVLSASSHAGLIDFGWKLFNSTIEIHGIRPTMRLQRNQPPPSHNFSDFLLLLLILGSAFAA
ncbi:hypothetical protein B296_00021789 [Ensete ventricosum]|uniref:Pentatricopeptide repeat-containing protein n=1 Tax=Ensete ventricosum TaxID=4639 RepID=A0A426ZKF5_ENSVE|nr:hypothetical protein B296_00021789 [Ensete ventricosum]